MNDDIRIAAYPDVAKILPLLVLHHQESGAWRGQLNGPLVHHCVAEMTNPLGRGIIGFVDGEPMARASIGLTVARFWDTGLRHLEPLWTFVHPDHRRTDYLKRLIGFAKSVAQDMNLPLVGAEEQNPGTERKRQLFERSMQQVGSVAIYSHQPSEIADVA